MKILIVDTGDVVRAPMMAAMLMKHAGGHLITSAGICTPDGLLADKDTVRLVWGEGIDIRRHRSTMLKPEHLLKADLVLTMIAYHSRHCWKISPESKGKVFTIAEFIGEKKDTGKAHGSLDLTIYGLGRMFAEIKLAAPKVAKKLKEGIPDGNPINARCSRGSRDDSSLADRDASAR